MVAPVDKAFLCYFNLNTVKILYLFKYSSFYELIRSTQCL